MRPLAALQPDARLRSLIYLDCDFMRLAFSTT